MPRKCRYIPGAESQTLIGSQRCISEFFIARQLTVFQFEFN